MKKGFIIKRINDNSYYSIQFRDWDRLLHASVYSTKESAEEVLEILIEKDKLYKIEKVYGRFQNRG